VYVFGQFAHYETSVYLVFARKRKILRYSRLCLVVYLQKNQSPESFYIKLRSLDDLKFKNSVNGKYNKSKKDHQSKTCRIFTIPNILKSSIFAF